MATAQLYPSALSRVIYLGDGDGTAVSSQLHELVNTEGILREQLLVYVLGLRLTETTDIMSLFLFSF